MVRLAGRRRRLSTGSSSPPPRPSLPGKLITQLRIGGILIAPDRSRPRGSSGSPGSSASDRRSTRARSARRAIRADCRGAERNAFNAPINSTSTFNREHRASTSEYIDAYRRFPPGRPFQSPEGRLPSTPRRGGRGCSNFASPASLPPPAPPTARDQQPAAADGLPDVGRGPLITTAGT